MRDSWTFTAGIEDTGSYAYVLIWKLVIAFAVASVLLALPFTWRRHQPGHCVTCGYNLTGNTSGRCPECGENAE